MAQSETRRPRRTPQERAAAVDEKIEKFNRSITELEAKKAAIAADCDAKIAAAQEHIKSLEAKKLAPKPPRRPRKTKKQKIQELVQMAVKNGMTVEDVANKLQMEIVD